MAIKIDYDQYNLWHTILGHANSKILQALKDHGLINFPNWLKQPNLCISCQIGKSCNCPSILCNKKLEFPLDKTFYDLSAPVNSIQKFGFYCLFIDDISQFYWLFPLKHKSGFIDFF